MRTLGMLAFPAVLALLTLSRSQDEPLDEDACPLAGQTRFEMDVRTWEGSFGSYLAPSSDGSVVLDLAQIGTDRLLTFGEESGSFDLGFLALTTDHVEGDAGTGWTRTVLLKGRRRPDSPDRTVLQLIARHEVERFRERDGRRIRLSGNMSHADLRIYTIRDDDTLQEYGRAGRSHDRDAR